MATSNDAPPTGPPGGNSAPAGGRAPRSRGEATKVGGTALGAEGTAKARTRSTRTGSKATPKAAAPVQVAQSIFDALGARDLDTAMSYVAEDAVDFFVAIGEFAGRVAIRGFFDELLNAFPDFAITVERIVGDDATAVVQWRALGTFTGGRFQGIEPTRRSVEIRGVDVLEIEGGAVRRNTIYYDGASFARQVGLLPTQGSGADRALVSAINAATNLRRRFA
jgi:steroid delta-isomerase-like uncharacterized protein